MFTDRFAPPVRTVALISSRVAMDEEQNQEQLEPQSEAHSEVRTEAEGEEGERDLEQEFEGGLLRGFVGLFIVPLMVVLLCVAVFVGFGWVAYERQTVSGYLNDLRSGWRSTRAQAAYELSKVLLADPEALDQEPGAKEELRKIFVEVEDPEIRRYLALVLGYTRDLDAVPVLTEALETADSQSRIYLLWALGTIGDVRAQPALTEALVDEDPGIRKTAAFALGEMGDPQSVDSLRPLLEDGQADVRWNAALAVSRLGSEAGVPELERMLDRRLTSQVPGITPDQQQETMISAIRALAAVQGQEALPLLERLGKEDPNLKVRQAAIEAQKAINS